MSISFRPIGFVKTDAEKIPRHWTVSNVEGQLVIQEQYTDGLRDIAKGQRIVVIFHFNQSIPFGTEHLIQKPPHLNMKRGVFSICSPIRPNPVGMSVLEVMAKEKNIIHVRGLDMLDGTPILDIKPYVNDVTGTPGPNALQKPF